MEKERKMGTRVNNMPATSTTEMSTAGSKVVVAAEKTNASKNAASEAAAGNRTNRQPQEQPAAGTGPTGGNRSQNAWGDEARRCERELIALDLA